METKQLLDAAKADLQVRADKVAGILTYYATRGVAGIVKYRYDDNNVCHAEVIVKEKKASAEQKAETQSETGSAQEEK